MVDFNNINQRISVIIFWALIFLCSEQVLAKSRVPISDLEIKEKKNECYADIESGLWGQQCTSSMIAKENCALRCLSPVCYELIYESDPLEEGEKDYTRNSEYKYCMHRPYKTCACKGRPNENGTSYRSILIDRLREYNWIPSTWYLLAKV